MTGVCARAMTTAAAATALLGALLVGAPGGAAHPSCALADAGSHAAVVVHHGDGRADQKVCVVFAGAGIGAEQTLARSGIEYQVAYYPAVQGDAVCQVDYEPTGGPWTSANCLGSQYWGVYISRRGGAWYSSPLGISDIQLADGDALGLTFGSRPPLPPSPQGVCPPPQPMVTPSAPATAPTSGGGGPPPGSGAGGGGGAAAGGGGVAGGGAASGAIAAGPQPDRSSASPAGSQPPRGIARPLSPVPATAGRLADFIRRLRELDGLLAASIAALAMAALAAYHLVAGPHGTMSARATATWSATAMVVVIAGNNPVYRVLVALAALNLLLAARRPGRSLKGLLMLVLTAGVFSIALNLLLSHGGTHVFAQLPRWLPGIGGPMSLESLAFGTGVATGVGAAALAVAPLSVVLEPHQLIDALPGPLQRTGAALAGSLNLVPGVARSFVGVREAQRLRGVSVGRAGAGSVLVPVLLTAMEGSVQLSEAMEARGYGSGPRTRYRSERWTAADVLTITTAALAATVFLAGRAMGLTMDWYPFPVLIVPSASLPVVAACVFLLEPSLWWKRGALP